jgi:23S rRNA pseudouridine1911/1915/1917 synthase
MAPASLTFSGSPMRLDRYLRDALGSHVGRRQVAALVRAGSVRVNGRVAAKSTLLRPGDEVTLADTAPAMPLRPIAAPLAVIHCDHELVAIDKPPGMPSTAGRTPAVSVAAALLERFQEMAEIDATRAAGLVHRLDTATSGLLLAARTPDAYQRLREGFRAKTLVKEYLAVVHGQVAGPGVVDARLARRPRGSRRMLVVKGMWGTRGTRGWRALTEYRPIARAERLSFVHLRMRTGVTHQLRVHLAHLGHPVLGDRRYGPREGAGQTGDAPAWHFLHALRLRSERGDLLPDLATPFPEHWAPLFARLGWPTDLPARW